MEKSSILSPLGLGRVKVLAMFSKKQFGKLFLDWGMFYV